MTKVFKIKLTNKAGQEVIIRQAGRDRCDALNRIDAMIESGELVIGFKYEYVWELM